MNHEQYYQAKKEFFRIGLKTDKTKEEIDRFNELLHDISKYEAETGMIDENEYQQKK